MPTTKTISTNQAKQVLDATHLLLVSAVPCKVFNIEGNTNSTTGTSYYIQLLGTSAPVSGTTVPLYSRLCVPSGNASGVNGFSFDYQPTGISTGELTNPVGGTLTTTGGNNLPVYAAISSTDNVYTAVAGNTQVSIDIEEYELENINQTVVGDTSSAVASLLVWADGTVNKLTQINATNNTGATAYLQMFSKVPTAGDVPAAVWTFTSSQNRVLGFGAGINPRSFDTTLHTGCYLYGSTTAGTFTASAASWTIKALYV